MKHHDTDYRLDEVDRRILYALMEDARTPTAAAIAERANVSGGTVRNRIQNLEDNGIIRGYSAHVDFERADGRLTNLYLCNVPVAEREPLTQQARTVPGVVHVRSLMTGRRNLHVQAVGTDTADLQRVARGLSRLGIEIEDEVLVEDERFEPYTPFDPEPSERRPGASDVVSLTGEANIVELPVDADAPIVDRSLEDARQRGVIDDDTLIIGIERDETELTPNGDTVVRANDIVTVLSRSGTGDDSLDAFGGSAPTGVAEAER